MVLVTGGTGLVGSHILFNLTKTGKNVRATYRNKDKISLVEKVFRYYTEDSNSLLNKIEWVHCNINDIPTLQENFKNVEQVYHCAALISFDPRDRRKLFKINVEGTTNIVNLSIENKVKKICHISTIGTIGNSIDGSPVDENTEFNSVLANLYATSKYKAEMEVWRGSQEGLKVIVTNPGFIVGPGFWDTGSGKTFSTIFKGLKFYPPGGTGFVNVTDVAKCSIDLMNSSISNERYILVAENLLYKEAFSNFAIALGKKPPQRLLKNWMLPILWRLDWLKSFLTNSERLLSKKMAQTIGITIVYNATKIEKDLGFKYEAIGNSIKSSAAIFLKENP